MASAVTVRVGSGTLGRMVGELAVVVGDDAVGAGGADAGACADCPLTEHPPAKLSTTTPTIGMAQGIRVC